MVESHGTDAGGTGNEMKELPAWYLSKSRRRQNELYEDCQKLKRKYNSLNSAKTIIEGKVTKIIPQPDQKRQYSWAQGNKIVVFSG